MSAGRIIHRLTQLECQNMLSSSVSQSPYYQSWWSFMAPSVSRFIYRPTCGFYRRITTQVVSEPSQSYKVSLKSPFVNKSSELIHKSKSPSSRVNTQILLAQARVSRQALVVRLLVSNIKNCAVLLTSRLFYVKKLFDETKVKFLFL